MFSRRVFELLACGTPVVSTQSIGIDSIFKELVPTVECEAEAVQVLDQLMTDAAAWLRASVRGQRAVYGEHTYAHRMAEIVRAVGLSDFNMARPDLLAIVSPNGDAVRFATQMAAQVDRPLMVLVADTPQRDSSALRHVDALRGAGLQALALPAGNVTSFVRERYSQSLVAVCASAHYYGPAYLRDARISLEGTPEVEASTMELRGDVQRFLFNLTFNEAARIGMTTSRAHGGTVVASARSPVLSEALARVDEEWFDLDGQRLRTRAHFEFVAHVNTGTLTDPTLINLN